jgi:signal transduction histidine kinase/ActR/RegA family two-component response regulator
MSESDLLGSTCEVYWLLDAELRVIAISRAASERLGLDPAQCIGKPIERLFEQLETTSGRGLGLDVRMALEHLVTSGRAQRSEPHARAAGASGVVHVPLLNERGQIACIVSVEERGVASGTGDELTRQRARHAAELVRSREELEARARSRTAELEHANAELLREIAEHIKTEKVLQRTQEQLSHAQRLDAIGQLAGGIAHDFNNLLSIVLGYSGSIATDLPSDHPVQADVEEIRRAGERAAELTRQLLAFGRRQVLEPRVLDLNEVVMRIDRMIRRIVGENIELVTMPGAALWPVKVDPGQIEQVILNLVINARDAMPSGGTLTIETHNVDFDQDYADANVGASAGPHVVLAVSDTGMGIPKGVQSRIFEPFFTTKEVGKGAGLGLSTVFGIVKQSGGHIWFYSELGQGTTFKLCFPRSDEQSSTDEARSEPVASPPRGHETILLVEDDPQLRAMARTILVRQGYQVLDAPDAAEALTMSARFSGEIALLLTDVVMPKMSGRDLARALLETRPRVKVLYMSGYTDNAIVHNGVLDPGVSFLQKPITPDALARKVHQVLSPRSTER